MGESCATYGLQAQTIWGELVLQSLQKNTRYDIDIRGSSFEAQIALPNVLPEKLPHSEKAKEKTKVPSL